MNREEFQASLAQRSRRTGCQPRYRRCGGMQNRFGRMHMHSWMSWKLLTAWLSTPTCTARGDKLRTRIIGTKVLGANLIAPQWMKNGRRWLRVCFPVLIRSRIGITISSRNRHT